MFKYLGWLLFVSTFSASAHDVYTNGSEELKIGHIDSRMILAVGKIVRYQSIRPEIRAKLYKVGPSTFEGKGRLSYTYQSGKSCSHSATLQISFEGNQIWATINLPNKWPDYDTCSGFGDKLLWWAVKKPLVLRERSSHEHRESDFRESDRNRQSARRGRDRSGRRDPNLRPGKKHIRKPVFE